MSRNFIVGSITIALALGGLSSCSSKTAEHESSHNTATTGPAAVAHPYKFSVHVTASGMGATPFDSWTMDTNGMMTVLVSRRQPNGKFKQLHAMAQLDAEDYDSLKMMVQKGKLDAIDSTDVTEICADAELYRVAIVALEGPKPSVLSFSACAVDYNLLLQPQREYFRMFFDWWQRMRAKYRPAEPADYLK